MSARNDILRNLERLEQEAYKKGWDAAIAHVLSAAQKSVQPSLDLIPPAASVLPAPPAVPSRVAGQEPSVIELTLSAIKAGNGLPGHVVAKLVQSAFPTSRHKAIERTVRTALARLKERGNIEIRDKKWFPKEGAAT
mgnify:FL=1